MPVIAAQAPYLSPVTLGGRPTSVPVNAFAAQGGAEAHFRRVGFDGSLSNSRRNRSAPMYSVPVMTRQEPGSLPVILRERSTCVPVTDWPDRVWPSSTFGRCGH